jgi:hypothetical protein
LAREIRRDDVRGTSRVLQIEASTSGQKGFDVNPTRARSQAGNKKKNSQWSENSKVIEGIFRKPAKLLQKEKKQVAQLLEDKFPPNENTGETPDKSVSQISYLKYIPSLKRAFTAKERNVRRKAGLINMGYEMHLSAYYQGLTFDKKGKLYMVNELNHMWVRDVFAEPFLTLVKILERKRLKVMFWLYIASGYLFLWVKVATKK